MILNHQQLLLSGPLIQVRFGTPLRSSYDHEPDLLFSVFLDIFVPYQGSRFREPALEYNFHFRQIR